MTVSVRDISTLVLGLPTRSRAMLVDLLLDSLDEGSAESHETAWLQVARQRDAELDSGSSEVRSHDEIMAAAHKAVRCAR